MNQFTIKIKELEDSLLARLSAAGGNFLGDYALVENLETTKRTAAEIEVKVAEGKTTEVKINEAREQYRPAAARSSLLYFILNDLNKINPIYQFSLKVSWLLCRNSMAGYVVCTSSKPSILIQAKSSNLCFCFRLSGIQCGVSKGYRQSWTCRRSETPSKQPDRLYHVFSVHLHHSRIVRKG